LHSLGQFPALWLAGWLLCLVVFVFFVLAVSLSIDEIRGADGQKDRRDWEQ